MSGVDRAGRSRTGDQLSFSWPDLIGNLHGLLQAKEVREVRAKYCGLH